MRTAARKQTLLKLALAVACMWIAGILAALFGMAMQSCAPAPLPGRDSPFIHADQLLPKKGA